MHHPHLIKLDASLQGEAVGDLAVHAIEPLWSRCNELHVVATLAALGEGPARLSHRGEGRLKQFIHGGNVGCKVLKLPPK